MEFNRKKILQLFNEKHTFTIRKTIQSYLNRKKVELFIKSMRWKAHLYENSGLNTLKSLNYIFRKRRFETQHKDLMQLENDLLELTKGVKFNK